MEVFVLPVTAFQQNCSLLRCTESGRAAIVDPGGDLPLIRAQIERERLEIEKILLTHGHLDHAGGAHELARELSVPVIGPAHADAFLLESLPLQGQMFGLDAASAVEPDQWLEHGDEVRVGNERFQVRHCPGHTPGHVIFYNRERSVALVGDVLFHGSIGRTDLPGGDPAAMVETLRTQILSLPDDTTFLPGHGPTSTIGVQRRTNLHLRGL